MYYYINFEGRENRKDWNLRGEKTEESGRGGEGKGRNGEEKDE